MKVAIKGPSESKTNITDNSNGVCTVEYIAQTPGLYEISIYFGDNEEEIPGIYILFSVSFFLLDFIFSVAVHCISFY